MLDTHMYVYVKHVWHHPQWKQEVFITLQLVWTTIRTRFRTFFIHIRKFSIRICKTGKKDKNPYSIIDSKSNNCSMVYIFIHLSNYSLVINLYIFWPMLYCRVSSNVGGQTSIHKRQTYICICLVYMQIWTKQ